MYSLDFTHEGKTTLANCDKKTSQRILNKLKFLAQNASKMNHLSLKGGFIGLFKLRVGDWRIIYELDKRERIITVHMVGHRKEIYR